MNNFIKTESKINDEHVLLKDYCKYYKGHNLLKSYIKWFTWTKQTI